VSWCLLRPWWAIELKVEEETRKLGSVVNNCSNVTANPTKIGFTVCFLGTGETEAEGLPAEWSRLFEGSAGAVEC
jgi:hypothetical protein